MCGLSAWPYDGYTSLHRLVQEIAFDRENVSSPWVSQGLSQLFSTFSGVGFRAFVLQRGVGGLTNCRSCFIEEFIGVVAGFQLFCIFIGFLQV